MKSSEKERIAKSGADRETELDNFDVNFTEGKISPLAIPLEKESSPPEEPFLGERRQQGAAAVKGISQKEFLDKVFAKIDEKVEDALKKRASFPGTITILLLLLASPFIINGGSDLYDMAKAQLIAPVVVVPEAVKPVADKKDDLRAILKQNATLVNELAKQNQAGQFRLAVQS